jgi:hypothetical protein
MNDPYPYLSIKCLIFVTIGILGKATLMPTMMPPPPSDFSIAGAGVMAVVPINS